MSFFGKIMEKIGDSLTTSRRSDVVQKWINELEEATTREKDWRKKAQEVIKLYEQDCNSDQTNLSDFNILYANTETLSPAVYNNTPRPVVKRKVDKENPVAILAAQVLKSALVYLADTGNQDEATFDDLQKSAVAEALVPGRGSARFYYEVESEGEAESMVIQKEEICGTQVPWNRELFGYAKNWQGIPWKAYEHFMTKDEVEKNFGPDKAKEIKLTHMQSLDDDKDKTNNEPVDAQGVKFAHIYEIWDKRDKKVKFISEGCDTVIKEVDDPLGLSGFFDAPRPVMFIQRISSLQPQTLYQMYEKQAEELEKATRRISGLLSAMKVRGFYDGTLEGLDQLLSKPENTLIPATNVAALQQGMTLEKSIWFMPLENLIVVLQQLYAARQQIIATIHQITGIADIMRGSSQASETLGAQEIKQAWGTMRLKRMQKEVQRFTRDCFRIQAELVAKHFSQATLARMTGLKLPTRQEQQMAQTQMDQLQQGFAQAQASGQPLGPPPPQLMQKAQQAQQVLGQPAWEDVIAFLRQDSICHYVIDIETNSTIDIEATEDKQELAEMMNSMSQLLNGILPMVEQGILPFDAAKSLMLAVVGKFRLGDEVEETFRAMQAPQPKADPAVQKAQAEMQMAQQNHELDMQSKQADIQAQKDIDAQKMQLERMKLDLDRQRLQMEQEFAVAKHARDMEMLAAKATMPPAAPQPQPSVQ